MTSTLPEGISPAELEAMEEQRKEEAMQAVAAIEAAKTAAVLEAFARIFNGGANRSELLPRVLGEAEVQTEAGPVKVAALSVAAAGEPALISAGKDSSAVVEVDAGEAGAFRIHFCRFKGLQVTLSVADVAIVFHVQLNSG